MNAIIIPGLSDRTKSIELATRWWKIFGITVKTIPFGWKDPVDQLDCKFDQIIKFGENLQKTQPIAIIGTSAGGNVALQLFQKRPDLFCCGIDICGRLRTGKHKYRSLENMSRKSLLFKKSVQRFESIESQIEQNTKSNMLTITGLFGDELVPKDTSILKGVKNIFIPTGEHIINITLALTIFALPIILFIRRSSKQIHN